MLSCMCHRYTSASMQLTDIGVMPWVTLSPQSQIKGADDEMDPATLYPVLLSYSMYSFLSGIIFFAGRTFLLELLPARNFSICPYNLRWNKFEGIIVTCLEWFDSKSLSADFPYEPTGPYYPQQRNATLFSILDIRNTKKSSECRPLSSRMQLNR